MTDVTRESLAAALRKADEGAALFLHPLAPSYGEQADMILASLPSPAPEPPPALSRGKGKGKEWGEGYSEGWFDASAGSGLAAFFDWAARSPHYSCSMEDEPEGTSRGVHLWHIYRKYHGAAQPAPDLDPPEAIWELRREPEDESWTFHDPTRPGFVAAGYTVEEAAAMAADAMQAWDEAAKESGISRLLHARSAPEEASNGRSE